MQSQTLRELRATSEELGGRLRGERKRLGMTQARLAASVGISTPTQVGYELGTRTPDANYVTAIERLGLDERYVRTGVHRNRAAVDDLDWEFFLSVQTAGEHWFKRELGITLDRRESTEIARLLYQVTIDQHTIEDSTVSRVLRLVVSHK
ncbi:MAG TPA: helix-turn-helix transcriptional regulator [Rhodanobacteraceae bacterium]|nr:helix-turn-helix transcriptional regulator [Rhodanobacteraceae bacterium]